MIRVSARWNAVVFLLSLFIVFISSYTNHIFEIISCFDFYLFYDHKCASVLLIIWNANVMPCMWGLSMYQFNLHENSDLIPAALIFSAQPLNSRMSPHPCLSYQGTRLRLHEYLFSPHITCKITETYSRNNFLVPFCKRFFWFLIQTFSFAFVYKCYTDIQRQQWWSVSCQVHPLPPLLSPQSEVRSWKVGPWHWEPDTGRLATWETWPWRGKLMWQHVATTLQSSDLTFMKRLRNISCHYDVTRWPEHSDIIQKTWTMNVHL